MSHGLKPVIGGHGCPETSVIRTTWPNNTKHLTSEFPILSKTVVADQYSSQYILLYPRGTFDADPNTYFCGYYRVTFLDANVVAHGDGGGILPLGTHFYSE